MSYYNNNGSSFLLSLETQGIKLGLTRTKKLLSICNNPENDLHSVQIIGTNGKGSTASSLSSILEQKKLKVGLYTSPHLVTLNERIQINRQHIPNQYINNFIKTYNQDITNLSCTFFEVMTVMSIKYFIDNRVDIAILETGLGGQFDSVTACKPSLQLFTSISYDHMHILGNTLEQITTEKAKAIQPYTPCISVNHSNPIKKILNSFAKQNRTSILYNTDTIDSLPPTTLLGEHQKENINLAIKAAQHLIDINMHNIISGIKNIYWPGRNQIISNNPTIIFDVAHNESSLIEFIHSMKLLNIKGNKTLLISIQKTKKINQAIPYLENYFDEIICTRLNNRMYNSKNLCTIFSNNTHTIAENNPSDTIQKTIKILHKDDLLAIVGSHYWGPIIQKSFKNSFVSQFR